MEQNKYYRIMITPSVDWTGYRHEPMYDEHPNLGLHKSTYGIGTPKQGDYIVQQPDGSLYVLRPTDPEHFEGVKFETMPPLTDLRVDCTIVETTAEILETDRNLRTAQTVLSKELYAIEIGMKELQEDMAQTRFGFPTKSARAARKTYSELETRYEKLQQQSEELEIRLSEEILIPLHQELDEQSTELKIELDEQNFKQTYLAPVQSHLNAEQIKFLPLGLKQFLMSASSLEEAFHFADDAEKSFILDRANAVYNHPGSNYDYEDRNYLIRLSTTATVCKELLSNGEYVGDHYPELEAMGRFEGDYNVLRMWEQIRFGKVIEVEYWGTYEHFIYEIQTDKPDYLEYRQKLYAQTIERICDKFPEYTFSKLDAASQETVATLTAAYCTGAGKASVAEHTAPTDEQIKAVAMQMIQQPMMNESEVEFEM